MPKIVIDPDSRSLSECYAVVKATRRQRARFPEGCVTPVADEAAARAGSDPTKGLQAAVVYGPSVSSEGQRVWYLVRWLD
jgi:hypothetical protein